MSDFDDFLDDVDRGRLGYNRSLTTGMPKLDGAIGGVQRATYYLIGANTGMGKTAFVDAAFVLNPFNHFRKQNDDLPKLGFRVFYYSFEISKKRKIAKWVCYLMLVKYGIIIDIKEVLSRTSTLSAEKYNKIKECRNFIEDMMEFVHIYDRPCNPFGVYKNTETYMLANGKVQDMSKTVKGVELKFQAYVPNDPNEIVINVVDHISLFRPETEYRTKKEIIDRDSENAISLRNIYGVSRVSVSQFNRDMADMDRRRFTDLSPQLEDFKNTGNSQEDSEVTMTLFNPLRYNIQEYGGMNLNRLGGRYRSLSVLKSRDGADMLKLNLNFLGEAGHFREFPNPMMDDDYNKAKEYRPFT